MSCNPAKPLKTYYSSTLYTDAVTHNLEITRDGVAGSAKGKPVMLTKAGLAVIDRGTSNWQVRSDQATRLVQEQARVPNHSVVQAQWLSTFDAMKHKIKVKSGSDGNFFGGMGALLVPDGFSIATDTATTDNVRYYGLSLIKNNDSFKVISEQADIFLMEYDYTADYKDDFLMQVTGGGGLFVETHNFPHIHIPMDENCGGYIVIGKKVSEEEFHFTAFQIPHGYALYTPANTIHGDGTLVGNYAIALADSSAVSADTVLMYNQNTKTMAKNIVPNWP